MAPLRRDVAMVTQAVMFGRYTFNTIQRRHDWKIFANFLHGHNANRHLRDPFDFKQNRKTNFRDAGEKKR